MDKVLEFIDEVFNGVITRPLMYGSMEVREVLVLTLLEMRRMILHPEDAKDKRKVHTDFSKFLYRTFYPDGTCKSLSGQVKDRGLDEDATDNEFTKILIKFINEQLKEIAED